VSKLKTWSELRFFPWSPRLVSTAQALNNNHARNCRVNPPSPIESLSLFSFRLRNPDSSFMSTCIRLQVPFQFPNFTQEDIKAPSRRVIILSPARMPTLMKSSVSVMNATEQTSAAVLIQARIRFQILPPDLSFWSVILPEHAVETVSLNNQQPIDPSNPVSSLQPHILKNSFLFVLITHHSPSHSRRTNLRRARQRYERFI
jgi:hypothetical protein